MIHRLPAVLNLLAGMLSEEQRKLWATPGWLPEEIGVIIASDGQFYCFEGDDIKYQLQRGYHNMVVYSLTGLAVNIESGHSSKGSHLIAMANGMNSSEPTLSHFDTLANLRQLLTLRRRHRGKASGTCSTISMSSCSQRRRL
jgi:hypothetical protein